MRVNLRTFSLCIVIALLSLVFLFIKRDAESISVVLMHVRASLEPSVAKNLNGATKSKQRPTATTSHRTR